MKKDKISHFENFDQASHLKEKANQCIIFNVFKYFDTQCPDYLNEVFVKAPKSGTSLRNSNHKLKQPFRKTGIGQNALSFIGPSLWNKNTEELKRTTSLEIFKNGLKKTFEENWKVKSF